MIDDRKTKFAWQEDVCEVKKMEDVYVMGDGTVLKPVDRKNLSAPLVTSGLNETGGFINEEFVPELRDYRGRKTLREMADNDDTIGAMLFVVSKIIKSVDWYIEPVDGTPHEIVRAINESLFNSKERPWRSVLNEIMTMFVYGFAPMEMQWHKNRDGVICLKDIGLKKQESVYRWGMAPGEIPVYMEIQTETKGMVRIPMSRIANFRIDHTLRNPEGRSMLRNCWANWVMKKYLTSEEAKQAARSSGIVVIKAPGEIQRGAVGSPEYAQRQSLIAAIRDLDTGKRGGIVLPSDSHPDGTPAYDLRFVTLEGSRPVDLSAAITRLDNGIARTAAMEFIMLGEHGGGSYALSTDKTELFQLAMQGILQSIADVIDTEICARAMGYNGLDKNLAPKTRFSEIEKPSLTKLSSSFSLLAGAGLITPGPKIESFLRGKAGIPYEDGESEAIMARDRIRDIASEQGFGRDDGQSDAE